MKKKSLKYLVLRERTQLAIVLNANRREYLFNHSRYWNFQLSLSIWVSYKYYAKSSLIEPLDVFSQRYNVKGFFIIPTELARFIKQIVSKLAIEIDSTYPEFYMRPVFLGMISKWRNIFTVPVLNKENTHRIIGTINVSMYAYNFSSARS